VVVDNSIDQRRMKLAPTKILSGRRLIFLFHNKEIKSSKEGACDRPTQSAYHLLPVD
jgi:hypothetical protein